MIEVQEKERIRRAYFVEHRSIRWHNMLLNAYRSVYLQQRHSVQFPCSYDIINMSFYLYDISLAYGSKEI